jgi:small-conductance mechanosensitive channel
MPNLSAATVSVIVRLLLSLCTGVIAVIANRALRKVLTAQIADPAHAHTLYVLVRNAVFLVVSIVLVFIWLGPGSNFTVAMGILGAGIAFASQEVIGSFAGYVNIVTGNLFRIGDRVQIGSVVGDVIDISILRTTVMEIGEWVGADQYTGRVVTIANRFVFSDPVYNYTQHWPYLWDEILIPITYGSDWQAAGELMLERAAEYSSHFLSQAQAGLRELEAEYPLHEATVEPKLYVVMTDNWLEMTLRYVVDPRERRKVKAQLHRDLLQGFEADPKITVASVTMEIVGFPPLRRDDQSA